MYTFVHERESFFNQAIRTTRGRDEISTAWASSDALERGVEVESQRQLAPTSTPLEIIQHQNCADIWCHGDGNHAATHLSAQNKLA
jgi:hypothetical protein